MTACRAALLLAALTCSAQALENGGARTTFYDPEVTSFSPDHVTVKLKYHVEYDTIKRLIREDPWVEKVKEHARGYGIQTHNLAQKFCNKYGKHGYLMDTNTISNRDKTEIDYYFHFACLDQPRP